MLSGVALAAAFLGGVSSLPAAVSPIIRTGCHPGPVFFHDLETDIGKEERQRLEPLLTWLSLDTVRRDVRIVLRTYNREADPFKTATHLLSKERAAHLRALIMTKGIDASRILIAYEDYRTSYVDNSWDLHGFSGGWIEVETYLFESAATTLTNRRPPSAASRDPC